MIEIKQSELSQILIDLDTCKYICGYIPKEKGKLLIDRIKKDKEIIVKLIKELKK